MAAGALVLGVTAAASALGGILASALGAKKLKMWVIHLRGGALVGQPAKDMDDAKMIQTHLAAKLGHSSLIVTKKPDGSFECSHPVRPTPQQKRRVLDHRMKLREERGQPIPPGWFRKQERLRASLRPR